MASLFTMPSGTQRIQFVAPISGKRKTIYLPDCRLVDARFILTKIQGILSAGLARQDMPAELARWLGEIDDPLYEKLESVGLVGSRQARGDASALLGPFVDAYITGRTDVKGSTAITYGNVRRNLITFFGERKLLSALTPGDADAFRRYLLTLKIVSRQQKPKLGEPVPAGRILAVNTVNKRCQIAKLIFKAAVRSRIIAVNPFADVKGGTIKANRGRDHFITPADALAIDRECPDAQWRLIFALSRYGGLRCPSEHLALTWDCVNWEKKLITVFSPKTERHPGGESRVIPMFPELETALTAVWEQLPEPAPVPTPPAGRRDRAGRAVLTGPAPEGQYVITRYRDAGTNLRTQFLKIIRRAGLKAWPRLFHNLRASRQTELMKRFPIHVVCEWLGNSRLIAQEHYLRVTDEDYAAALRPTPRETPEAASRDAAKTHQRRKTTQNDASALDDKSEKPPENADFSGNDGGPDGRYWTRIITQKPLESDIFDTSATQQRRTAGPDVDLARLVDAWPALPERVRRKIVALVADAADVNLARLA
jgi:integrase